MEERLRFVARLLEGEAMSEICREFGVSRKTGYKIFERYKDHGLEALSDRSRRPIRYANQLPGQIESLIVRCKQEKPHWGARKIRELLVRRLDGDFRLPAKSTIHAVLCRHGLVKPLNAPRRRAAGTPLSQGRAPNDLWCADFKGEFKLGDGRYCYPLTVTDHASRYLLLCEALENRPARTPPSPPSSSSSRNAACPRRSVPTMASLSPVRTVCSISPSSPSGGSDSASPSNASSPAILMRTDATSACISRSRRRRPARRA
jgi:transposase